MLENTPVLSGLGVWVSKGVVCGASSPSRSIRANVSFGCSQPEPKLAVVASSGPAPNNT